jgi:hypothetical protein
MVGFLNLTTQEKKVLGFLLALTLLGGGVMAYRAFFDERESPHPHGAFRIVPTYDERKSP